VIGLEVHAQLKTRTKIFCGCEIRFGVEPNAATCPVCVGMPGVLPVLNREVVAMAVAAALASNCTIHRLSRFARKNYFYPDLPKGYQISQYELPLATKGHVSIPTADGGLKRVGLVRIHLEEDAGKSIHDAGHATLVDFNRSGVPLIEIVGEPEIRSSDEAAEYLKALRSVLRYVGVCSGDMEKGEFRCDANVSIRPRGAEKFGTRVEVKNMNSFRHVQRAIDYEIARQADLIDAGGAVVQETRLWNPDKNITQAMRSKEEAHDYRYFPEPDLPPLIVEPTWVDELRASLPELPAERRDRYMSSFGLSAYDASVLTAERPVAEFFDALVSGGAPAKAAANWTMGEVQRVMNKESLDAPPISAARLGELILAVEKNVVSGTAAKRVFEEMLAREGSALEIIRALGLEQVSDQDALSKAIDDVLAASPEEVERFKAGKKQLMGFFVGKVMKAMGGKANPGVVNELLTKKLGG
jgi:aspartyl-tRNA(Asn)/glutamyl-tRNA(Gln) amidotransferase subunit B